MCMKTLEKPLSTDSFQDPASFRDPAGYVFYRDNEPYRYISPSYYETYKKLHASGLYLALIDKGYIVPIEEISEEQGPNGPSLIVKPQPIPFISYPYEWSFSQLKEAALCTLEVHKLALRHGMQLKDASVYNVQFIGTKPVFIDTLSFTERDSSVPWIAYKQFCHHFLGPLSLCSFVDVRLNRLFISHLDGIPLDLAKKLLPKRAYFSLSRFLHIWLHERFQQKSGQQPSSVRKKGACSMQAALGLVESLEQAVKGLAVKKSPTVWQEYYSGDSYEKAGFEEKNGHVERLLSQLAPNLLWDLGSNNGHFTELVSKYAKYSIAFDFDTNCIEEMYQRLRKKNTSTILPLQMDLANPSPGIGWEGKERKAFLERGRCDVALALALIHHLLVTAAIPFERVVNFFASIATHVIIEYVPPSDPKFRQISLTNQNDFSYFTEEFFETAFAKCFDLQAKIPINTSSRVLYHFQKKSNF